MKKLLLMAAAACTLGFSASAAQFPELELFNLSYDDQSTSLVPCTSWASDQTLADTFKKYFEGSGWNVLTFTNGDSYVMSCSTFEDRSLQANAGLVTPKVAIPADGAIFTFTAMNWNPEYTNRTNRMKVYVSTTGNSKEDFTEENLVSTISVKADSKTTGPTVKSYDVSLADYAGKEVYIALVNVGTNAGTLGLNNFLMNKYKASVEITTPSLYTNEGSYAVGCVAQLRTSVPCKGFTAELVIDGQVKSTYSTTRELSTAYNSYTISFPDKIELKMDQAVDYEIRLTPNYEGAPAIVVPGFVSCVEGFPGVAVEEEGTGVGCGFCPLGAAFLSYFSDTYPDNFIGIAVHGGGYASGVMTAPTYSNYFLNYYNTRGGYPFCTVNREQHSSADMYPSPNLFQSIEPAVLARINKKTALKVDIDHAFYATEDKKITVVFTPQTAINIKNSNYRAAVVLLADGLKGDAKNQYWAQANNYSGYTDTRLASFGINDNNREALRPYYEVYTKAPGYYFGCEFDHVAMGCWPDWRGEGCPLDAAMDMNAPKSYSITFDVPFQVATDGFGVQDITKTSVVVLIFDAGSGEIVTAKKMKYADFELMSGVENVSGEVAGMQAYRTGDVITVKAAPGTVAEIYGIDGSLLGKKVITSGEDTIAPLGYRGLVIVRLTNGTDSYFNKIMF